MQEQTHLLNARMLGWSSRDRPPARGTNWQFSTRSRSTERGHVPARSCVAQPALPSDNFPHEICAHTVSSRSSACSILVAGAVERRPTTPPLVVPDWTNGTINISHHAPLTTHDPMTPRGWVLWVLLPGKVAQKLQRIEFIAGTTSKGWLLYRLQTHKLLQSSPTPVLDPKIAGQVEDFRGLRLYLQSQLIRQSNQRGVWWSVRCTAGTSCPRTHSPRPILVQLLEDFPLTELQEPNAYITKTVNCHFVVHNGVQHPKGPFTNN